MNEKLRFAPLVRVSTEAQEQRGESLKIQSEKIKDAVKGMGGKIVSWDYTAQEHSTPDAERRILDKLLDDAGKGKFDAVIVDDVSRWARDNLKSEQGIRILKKYNIRFFVRSIEYDLHSPSHKFLLTSTVSLSEMYALTMAERGLEAKIKKTREGKPAVGKLPYGRTFDKEKQEWGIDPEAKERVENAANMMLSGSTMEAISEETGLSERQIYKLFRGGAGDTWTVKFNPKLFPKMKREETITVPPLLPKVTMQALAKKLDRGKAFYHGNRNRKPQLLTGSLFCGHCGYALSGAAIGPNANRYYMHPRTSGKRLIGCHEFYYCKAEPLEDAVMRDIMENFGDERKRAELFSKSNGGASAKAKKDLKRYEQELKKVQRAQERLLDAIEDESLPMDQIKARAKKRKVEEESLIEKIESLKAELSSIPTKDELSGMEKALKDAIDWAYWGTEAHLSEMTFDQKRDLLRLIFGNAERHPGRDKKKGEVQPKFLKAGIYVERTARGWRYKIKGAFPVILGRLSAGETPLKIQDPWFLPHSC